MNNEIKAFMKFLVIHRGYSYWGNHTVHCFIDKQGVIKFWENYKGDESRLYSSFLNFIEKRNIPIPTQEELKKLES